MTSSSNWPHFQWQQWNNESFNHNFFKSTQKSKIALFNRCGLQKNSYRESKGSKTFQLKVTYPIRPCWSYLSKFVYKRKTLNCAEITISVPVESYNSPKWNSWENVKNPFIFKASLSSTICLWYAINLDFYRI